MIEELRYTLRSDGSSDKALIPILTWLLREHKVECAIQSTWADLRRLRKPHKTLSEQIKWSLELYPCDLLFIHRDAEKEGLEKRIAEITEAVEEVSEDLSNIPPKICVIPVRMQEAWLLINEEAIRQAVGNPNGKQKIQLPQIDEIEKLVRPKDELFDLLREASGRKGRRLQQLDVRLCANRVTEFIDDFSPLRSLPAFQILDNDIERIVKEQSWVTSNLP